MVSLGSPRRALGSSGKDLGLAQTPSDTPTPKKEMKCVRNCILGEIVTGEKFTLVKNSVCERLWSESHFRLVIFLGPHEI